MSEILVIDERLPGLNEYIKACRSNKYAGAAMKKRVEERIGFYILKSGIGPVNSAFEANFTWFISNMRRDPDNIAFAKKFILDALQKYKIIKNDSAKFVKNLSDTFIYSKCEGVIVKLI